MSPLRRVLLGVAHRLPPAVLTQPLPLFVVIACVLSGLASLLRFTPSSVALLLPPWSVALWNANLVLGGLFAAAGMIRGHWRAQVAGFMPLGTAAIAYGVAIIAAAGTRGVVGAIIITMFGLSAWVQALAVWSAITVVQHRAEGAPDP